LFGWVGLGWDGLGWVGATQIPNRCRALCPGGSWTTLERILNDSWAISEGLFLNDSWGRILVTFLKGSWAILERFLFTIPGRDSWAILERFLNDDWATFEGFFLNDSWSRVLVTFLEGSCAFLGWFLSEFLKGPLKEDRWKSLGGGFLSDFWRRFLEQFLKQVSCHIPEEFLSDSWRYLERFLKDFWRVCWRRILEGGFLSDFWRPFLERFLQQVSCHFPEGFLRDSWATFEGFC